MLDKLKDKPKSFRNAFIVNSITITIMLVATIMLITTALQSGDSVHDIVILSVFLILFDFLNILILIIFLKNHKFAKIYFMLINVFGLYIATWFKLIGFLLVVYLVISLFINIKCYRNMHQ